MDFLLHSPTAHVCLGAGLAGLCGFRAFLPIALLGLFSRLGYLAAPSLANTPFSFLEQTWVIIVFFVLAVVEMGLDKISEQRLAVDFVFNPLRVLAGALAFASTLAEYGTVPLVVGAVAGAIIALVAHVAQGALRSAVDGAGTERSAPFLSFFEDIAVIIGAFALLLLPWLGIPVLFFVFFLVYRVRVRRKRKYRGLRILRD